jgi:hypothetical protein
VARRGVVSVEESLCNPQFAMSPTDATQSQLLVQATVFDGIQQPLDASLSIGG